MMVKTLKIITFFIFNLSICFSQELTDNKIGEYVNSIDSLFRGNKLILFNYPNLTFWGSVSAYFHGKELVFAKTISRGELGYKSTEIYFENDFPCKIVEESHFPNWVQHAINFPEDEDSNYDKMTYSDEKFEFIIGEKCKMYQKKEDSLILIENNLEMINNEILNSKLIFDFIVKMK